MDRRLWHERSGHGLTRLGTFTARLGTDGAVLVVLAVAAALIGAGAAHLDARLELRTQCGGVAMTRPCHEGSGDAADLRAVEAQPHARHHLRHVVLPEARVGANRARLLALRARLYAPSRSVPVGTGRVRVRVEHPLQSVHVVSWVRVAGAALQLTHRHPPA
jgi:hypothetical protein